MSTHTTAAPPATPVPAPDPAPAAPAATLTSTPTTVTGKLKGVAAAAEAFLKTIHPLMEIGEWVGILAGVSAYLEQAGIRKSSKGITVNPQGFRSGAPHWAMQSRKKSISATFTLVMQKFSDETSPGHCKILVEVWMPQLGENQQADFAMHVVEMACNKPIWDVESGHAPEKISPLVIGFLKRLAEVSSGDVAIDNQRRTQIADSLNLVRGCESDYPAVKVVNWVRQHHAVLVTQMQNRLAQRRSSFFGRLAETLIG